MPSFTPRPVAVDALPVSDLIAGLKLGVLEMPAWLDALRQAGRLRIRPDAVEVYMPAGIVVAGPADMLVSHADGAFPLRADWFDALFAPLHTP